MSPYLSIVTAGRNDSYSLGLLERMQDSVDSIITNARAFNLNAEYVFVEWGNPEGAEHVEEVIDFRGATIPIRIIRVPRAIVDSIKNPNKTFLDAWAKNVGIRRSYGDFILTTNCDDIYSGGMIDFLAKQELSKECFYRVNLHNTRNGKVTWVCKSGDDTLHFGAAGDFILMGHTQYCDKVRGWPEIPYWNSVDGMTVHLAGQEGLKQVILDYSVYHPEHDKQDFSDCVQPWDDHKPHATKNGLDWGFRGVEFEEIRLGRQ